MNVATWPVNELPLVAMTSVPVAVSGASVGLMTNWAVVSTLWPVAPSLMFHVPLALPGFKFSVGSLVT